MLLKISKVLINSRYMQLSFIYAQLLEIKVSFQIHVSIFAFKRSPHSKILEIHAVLIPLRINPASQNLIARR